MKTINELPEKFTFKLDEIGKRWVRETFGTDSYDDYNENHFFIFPNYTTQKGFLLGHHTSLGAKKDYPTIETSELFAPSIPTIPTIEKGLIMLVWDIKEEWAWKSEVMFQHGKHFVCKSILEGTFYLVKHAKPIPQLPEFTIEEAEQKFNIKIKQ